MLIKSLKFSLYFFWCLSSIKIILPTEGIEPESQKGYKHTSFPSTELNVIIYFLLYNILSICTLIHRQDDIFNDNSLKQL